MKSVSKFALAAVVLVGSMAGGAASAYADQNDNSIFEFKPAQCASEQTKADHPEWYRDGGYCNPHDWDDI